MCVLKSYKAVKIIRSIAKVKTETNSFRWPPLCAGILHQPKRPMKRVCNCKGLHTQNE